jgi:hypothetical protein
MRILHQSQASRKSLDRFFYPKVGFVWNLAEALRKIDGSWQGRKVGA